MKIEKINDKKIRVKFDIGKKSFDYPYAFHKFLTLENQELVDIVHEKKGEIEDDKVKKDTK